LLHYNVGNKILGAFEQHKVDANYDGSILAKITLPISPYKILLNNSNGHGYYFKNVIIIFE
jgi:hypothetical protein